MSSSKLHPSHFPIPANVWRAAALASAVAQVVATGEAALDAQLPGGGWPVGALTEILQGPQVHAEWRLLLSALARCGSAAVLLVAPPHVPFGPALSAQGLVLRRLMCVRADATRERLWAAEQSLRCAGVDAVLVWLPLARADQLRRLQLAAAEFNKLLFVIRPSQAQSESTPAELRLLLEPGGPLNSAVSQGGSYDKLRVHCLKRRGPPLEQPIELRAGTPVLTRLLAAQTIDLLRRGHALDCTAACA